MQVFPGQWWNAVFEFAHLTRAQGAAIEAFLARLNGREGTFLLGHPLHSTPAGVATGAPVVQGGNQSGSSLKTAGWTPNVTGILLAGDHIQIGSGATARLYRITADSDSNSSGEAVLEVWPKIRQSPMPSADGATIITSNPKSVFRLNPDQGKNYGLVRLSPPAVYTWTLQAREAL
ncbi:MAG: hypothetical protein ABT940_07270 [Alphaproteobacteria bacterium]